MGPVLRVVQYMFTPRILLTHFIAVCLLGGLLRQGIGPRKLVPVLIVEELITVLLWLIIPNSWATIITLWICIWIYETLQGPKIEVKENATFLTGEDISGILKSIRPNLKFRLEHSEDGNFRLRTNFQYVVHSPQYWGKPKDDRTYQDIDMSDVAGVEEGCDYNIIRSIRLKGAEPSQCFHLTVGDGQTTVTVICPTKVERDSWFEALQYFYGKRLENFRSAWLSKLWKEANVKSVNGQVNFDETVRILEKANRPTDRGYLKLLYNKLFLTKNVSDKVIMSQEQFGKLFDEASTMIDIQQVYEKLLDRTKGEMVLTPFKYREFLQNEQKELVTLSTAKEWIRLAETVLPSYNLTAIGFSNILLSTDHNIFNRLCRVVYQDMTQPLCHYFIATSHNTYLTKDQLKSKSSVDAYINAFKKGCKSVELDCWDGPNNEPIIYHGHTLTSKILFRDVVQAIADYAFVISEYPVILSFENHCSVEQQKVMAEHLRKILGSKLYTKQPLESETVLPSPQDLRNYVFVKAKKLKHGVVDDVDDEYDEISDEVLERLAKEQQENKEEKEEDEQSIDGDENGIGGGDEKKPVGGIRGLLSRASIDIKRMQREAKQDKVPKISQELSDIVSQCQAVSFKGFQYAKDNTKHYEMSSFGENRAMKFALIDTALFLDYTKHHLSRIYPAGARVDSSNYEPIPLWNVGCQLVALNYQTPARPMQINQGLFQDNGGCGYVLKPEFLRSDNSSFDPRGPFNDNSAKRIVLKIISGSQIPYNNENKISKERSLLVEVRISGVEPDEQKQRSKAVRNNGFNPQWNEELFFKVFAPELAFLTFTLKEHPQTFIAQYTLPLRCAMEGYRRVPLQKKSSEYIPNSALFVHLHIYES